MKPCLLLPHGVYSLVITVCVTFGWMCALFEDGCNYAKLSGDLDTFLVSSDTPYLEVGLQAYRMPEVNLVNDRWDPVLAGACVTYPGEVQMDTPWKLARAFSSLSLVLGGGATFYLWISACCRFSRGSWRWAGYEVAAACVFQALSFVWFHTELCQTNTCELFYGSKADIASGLLWLLAAVLIFAHYPVPREMVETDGIMNDSNGSRRSSSSTSSSRSRRRKRDEGIDDGEDGDDFGDLALTEVTTPSPTKENENNRPDEEMAAGESPSEAKRPILDEATLT